MSERPSAPRERVNTPPWCAGARPPSWGEPARGQENTPWSVPRAASEAPSLFSAWGKGFAMVLTEPFCQPGPARAAGARTASRLGQTGGRGPMLLLGLVYRGETAQQSEPGTIPTLGGTVAAVPDQSLHKGRWTRMANAERVLPQQLCRPQLHKAWPEVKPDLPQANSRLHLRPAV